MIYLRKAIWLYIIIFNNVLLSVQPNININNYNGNISINLPNIQELTKKFLELSKKNYPTNTNWLNNRKTLTGIGLGGFYIYLNSHLIYGKKILNNKNNWSNWKNDHNLNDILNKPTNQLCRELYQSILDKYNNNNQSDLISPLVTFSKELEQELSVLKVFCKVGAFLKGAKISFLFLITNHDLETAHEKINRLTYLKKIITESIQISLNQ